MRSTQEILNAVRLDEDGNPINTVESMQQAFNAIFDPGSNALRIKNTGGVIIGADGSKLGIWAAAESYSAADLTSYQGIIYIALQPSINKNPLTQPLYWTPYPPAYEGNDTPGTGVNTLLNGQSRVWRQMSTGRIFNISKINNKYYSVELGEI